MKRLLVLMIVITGFSWISCTGIDQKPAGNAVLSDTAKFTTIKWIDSTVNFGTIKMGEKIRIAFRFQNSGKYPLFLTNVRAGCGCTVPDFTKGAIAPGGEGVVTGAFDSNKAHTGEVRKTIFVTANTHGEINHTLIFTGVIEESTTK